MDNIVDIKWIKALLTIIAVVVIVYVLRELKAIFLPLVFAAFLSFIFYPLNRFLYNHKIPKPLVIILMMIIVLAVFALLGLIIYISVNSFIIEFPKYQARMITMINESYSDMQGLILRMEGIFSKIPEWFDRSQILSPGSISIPRIVTGTMGTFFDFLVQLFLTLIFLMFIVAGAEKMGKRIRRVLTESYNRRTFYMIDNIQHQMTKYFLNKSLISLGTAMTSMFFVLIFRVDFVIMTGLLIFTLNFIPNIGSIIASGFPILICFLQYGFGWRFLGLASFMIMTQMTFGNIIEPNLMGERLNLSPIVVLLSLIFWGWVWGPVGMIVAVPLTSAINIVVKELDSASLFSAIISGD